MELLLYRLGLLLLKVLFNALIHHLNGLLRLSNMEE